MKVKIPENQNLEKQLNIIIRQLESLAKDRTSKEITGLGSEPVQDKENEVFIFNDDGTRKLVIRNQGRNYSVDLSEVT